MQTAAPRYLSAAETAKLVRRALKEAFPGQKFSVRSDTYSGGASIDVKWTDGPRRATVEAVAKQYQGGGFDGSIDLMHYATHYLRPDGRVLLAHDSGTEGSRGYVPAQDNRDLATVLPDDVEEVRFGADFIFCTRELSDREGWTREAEAYIRAHCILMEHPGRPELDRFGNDYVVNVAMNLAYDHLEDESWEATFERRYS